MGKDEKNIIVAHAHWDREWYLPFSLMRFRLVAMMDKLVNVLETDKEFSSFMLDGQTCMLEDYVEIRPAMKERIGALIKAGRIQIGPYYVLNDAWLQTGEGYIRNLLVGHAISREWGVRPMKVGYVPDQYNHFEQMPQVLAGFGVKAMAFGRSMGNQQEEHGLGFEFEWKAPDGSSVLALHLIGGYGMCSGLPDQPELAVDMLVFGRGAIRQIKKATRWSLMFSGDDHRLPEHVLPAAIRAWNGIDEITEDEGTLQLGTMEEFVNHVLGEKPDLPAYTGELRGARYQRAFQGVYSSCMPLKRRNAFAHDVLERYAEPLAAISTSIAGTDYRGFLAVAWRELLKNQAHDSAWAASWNQVMKEMDTRFDVAIQNAEETRNWALLDITSRILVQKVSDSQVEVILFNPLEYARAEPITFVLPANFDLEAGYTLMAASGQAMRSSFEPVPTSNEEIFLVRKFVGSHGSRPKRFYKMHVEAVEVPALGYTTLVVAPAVRKTAPVGGDFGLQDRSRPMPAISRTTRSGSISTGTARWISWIKGRATRTTTSTRSRTSRTSATATSFNRSRATSPFHRPRARREANSLGTRASRPRSRCPSIWPFPRRQNTVRSGQTARSCFPSSFSSRSTRGTTRESRSPSTWRIKHGITSSLASSRPGSSRAK